MRGLERLIKLLEENAISEIGEAESEAIAKLLGRLLDLTECDEGEHFN